MRYVDGMSVDEPIRLLSVLRGLMRPLVRTLISRGVTAPTFYKLLKSVYVEVAQEEFRIDEEEPTDSRISLLTGVHRRDVRSILSADTQEWRDAKVKTSTFATVLGQWISRRDYRDDHGVPMKLPRRAAEGLSFERLVRSINMDIRPKTVLDELIRQGLVVEYDAGLLGLTSDALAGPSSDVDALVFFASNVGDHLAAASANLLSDEPPFYERAVFYNHLLPASVDNMEARARDLAQTTLETLNAESSTLQNEDRDATGVKERYRFGVYFYREPSSGGTKGTKDFSGETDN